MGFDRLDVIVTPPVVNVRKAGVGESAMGLHIVLCKIRRVPAMSSCVDVLICLDGWKRVHALCEVSITGVLVSGIEVAAQNIQYR